LRNDHPVIEGLFAVGNVSAHPLAYGYPGAVATLGPAMTMGYAVGRNIAGLPAP
jgi:3-oxosteroid 1-dehydrogenase